ncbi:MAG: aldo/keto reductase [Candidatus Promineifilaceae bacterium]|nr:aldo/keto reductase [Candidatus Promineifilaceae bacterium]
MNRRPLGHSELMVTPMGLGLAALGRPGYINLGHAEDLDRNYDVSAMERHAHEVMDAAWHGGIRYFDAARSYGRAEQFLSSWLASRNIDTDAVVVGSKWGYTYTADWQVEAEKHEVKEHSLAVLKRQTEESLTLLDEHLDLYQIHSATLASGVLSNQAVLSELQRLKTLGLHIGLTLSGPNQAETLRRALDVRHDGHPLFETVQATWNLLERSAEAALAEAQQAGLGVIVKEALANGRLTSRNQRPGFAQRRKQLEEIAAAQQTTMDGLALAAAMAQPWATVVLSGAATVEHVRANLQALDVDWTPELEEALAFLTESPDDYWKIRSNLAWN